MSTRDDRSPLVWLGGALFLLTACGTGMEVPFEPTGAAVQVHVFDRYCSDGACHGGSAPESGLHLTPGRSMTQLVDIASTGIADRIRVVPGDADSSYLVHKLEGGTIVGERMPLGRPPLPDSIVALVRTWIDRGAPI